MKNHIAVYGTSLLAPGNRNWLKLHQDYPLLFADYGSWRSAFLEGDPMAEKTTALLWICFFDDLISPSAQCLLQENEAIHGVIEEILTPLRQHLSHDPRETIVAYSKLGLERSPPPEISRRLNKEAYAAQELERQLLALRERFPHLYAYPLDLAFSNEGYRNCTDYRNYYAARCRLSSAGIKAIAENIAPILDRMHYPRKKVLVLDGDNTLWGGVLGEISIEGIQVGQDGTGSVYRDFQWVIKALAAQGIVLALASKNNFDEVVQVLNKHPGMALKQDDFSSLKINWGEKADNIRQISQELGLSLDSFVFWDDSPLEREMVRLKLPEVSVIEPEGDISLWPQQLKMYPGFSQFETTDEDKSKTLQYRARAEFHSQMEPRADKKSYLKSIAMEPRALPLDETTLNRAFQLCEKTNQFNLRTIRHSLEDLRKIMKNGDWQGLLIGLKDKFGDHGLVGLILARTTDKAGEAFLDTFLLSCRVIGRNLESWMLHETIRLLKERGIRSLTAEYIPTAKNQPAQSFLQDHGFIKMNGMEALDLNACVIPHREVFSRE